MTWLCGLIGHRRSDHVWFDGLDFRADCVRCGCSMMRDAMVREWRPMTGADSSDQRLTHEQSRAQVRDTFG